MGIPLTYVSDKQTYREFSNSGQAMVRDDDRYFVERQSDGNWKIVEPTDRFVSTDELGKNFGLWQDREITKGHLWWKEVTREKNGLVEPDEVITMAEVMRQQCDSVVGPDGFGYDLDRLQPLKTELTLTKDGGNLHTDWKTLYRYTDLSGPLRNPYLF